MPSPNPQLRISPSGPFTDGDTDPLREYAGEVNTFNDPAGNEYIGVLGPSGAPDDTTHVVLQRASSPQPTDYAQVVALPPLNNGGVLTFGEGVWLVEAQISCGFNTSWPDSDDSWGDIALSARLGLNAAPNTIQKSASMGVSPIPRGILNTVTATQSIVDNGVSHSVTKFTTIKITADDIAANGGHPFSSLGVVVSRVSATAVGVGSLNTGSGWLELTRDCSLSVRRYR